MGYLHDGHLALLRAARERCEVVVMSLFVNPTQFAPDEDLESYPRDEGRDAEVAERAGVDLLYAPAVAEVYPDGFSTSVEVARELTGVLEGAADQRGPAHFRGVATVVAKLLNSVGPDVAFFGQKDAQQAVVIRRMARDLDFPVRIQVMPTVREPDGLAMSSRNRLLAPADREAARCVPRALAAAAGVVASGETLAALVVGAATAAIASEPRARLEYAELRDPETLEEVKEVAAPALLALAVWVGGVRLIDNRVLVPGGQR
jgi:pantoate--beta-alanine ligase